MSWLEAVLLPKSRPWGRISWLWFIKVIKVSVFFLFRGIFQPSKLHLFVGNFKNNRIEILPDAFLQTFSLDFQVSWLNQVVVQARIHQGCRSKITQQQGRRSVEQQDYNQDDQNCGKTEDESLQSNDGHTGEDCHPRKGNRLNGIYKHFH